jgi:hypothetical protein
MRALISLGVMTFVSGLAYTNQTSTFPSFSLGHVMTRNPLLLPSAMSELLTRIL